VGEDPARLASGSPSERIRRRLTRGRSRRAVISCHSPSLSLCRRLPLSTPSSSGSGRLSTSSADPKLQGSTAPPTGRPRLARRSARASPGLSKRSTTRPEGAARSNASSPIVSAAQASKPVLSVGCGMTCSCPRWEDGPRLTCNRSALAFRSRLLSPRRRQRCAARSGSFAHQQWIVALRCLGR
jgi:hypothetical protein